jgi:hypothetical protein
MVEALGGGGTSLGRDNPSRKVGYISANAIYDRKTADSSRRTNNPLFTFHDSVNLDIVPDEIAFKVVKRSNNPYGASRNALPVLTSLNGLTFDKDDGGGGPELRAQKLQESIVPIGIAIDRIEYAEDRVQQMGRKQIAVQTNGVVSVRSMDPDIPIGTWVSAVVPEPSDESPHRRVQQGKVTLQIAPSFANPAQQNDEGHGDVSFASRMAAAMEKVPDEPETTMDKALKTIRDNLSVGADKLKVMGAIADLVRTDSNNVLGRVIHAKNGVYDIVM